MEFAFDVNRVLPERVTVVQRPKGRPSRRLSRGGEENGTECQLQQIVDDMGAASAKAQGLPSPITTYDKLIQTDQTLYILKDESENRGMGVVLGILKTGRKRLFLTDPNSVLREVEPVCILDFYVHESQQRKGHGKTLFEFVLQREQVKAFEVAIDRPSPKFLSFLQKHYHLSSYVRQNNNFVVFNKFFTTCIDATQSKRRRSLSPPHDSLSKPGKSMDTLGFFLSPQERYNIPTAHTSVPMKWTDDKNNPSSIKTNLSTVETPTTFSKPYHQHEPSQGYTNLRNSGVAHHLTMRRPDGVLASHLTTRENNSLHSVRDKTDVFATHLTVRDKGDVAAPHLTNNDIIAPHLTLRDKWRRTVNRRESFNTVFGQPLHSHSNTITTSPPQSVSTRHFQPAAFRYSRHVSPQETESEQLQSNTGRGSTLIPHDTPRSMTHGPLPSYATHAYKMHQLSRNLSDDKIRQD